MYLIKCPTTVLLDTKLAYLKAAKLEQLIMYLMHFDCVEVTLKYN